MRFLPCGIPASRILIRLVTLVALSTACGRTTSSTGDDPLAPDGSGGTGGGGTGGHGSGGNSTVGGGTGGGLSTGDGFTAFSTVNGSGFGTSSGSGGVSTASSGFNTTGSSGFNTTGSGGFGGFSTTGVGGATSCYTSQRRLEACTLVGASAMGVAGAGGAEPDPEIDACWGTQAPVTCDVSLEGQVIRVGEAPADETCGVPLFEEPADSSERRRQYVDIDAGEFSVSVMLGVAGDLGVQVGHTVEVRLVRESYHDEFMQGARLTLKRNGQLLAIANNNLPIDAPARLGDLTLSRGPETCRGDEDVFTCRYVAHALHVERGDEAVSVPPNSSAQLGPFEIVTEGNYLVESGGGCDTGDSSDFVIARVQP